MRGERILPIEEWRDTAEVRWDYPILPSADAMTTAGIDVYPTAVMMRWETEAAALRAWAAVGAPVLAPAEDGKASFAEWVAPFDERGLRLRCTWYDGSMGLWHFLPGAVVGWQSENDDIGPEGPMLYRDGCPGGDYIATPAELRACLDRLAAEAQR